MIDERKPKVLVLSPDLPYPITGGGQMRTSGLMESMIKFADVEMVCVAPGLPPETELWAEQRNIRISTINPGRRGMAHAWQRRIIAFVTMSNLEYDRRIDKEVGRRIGDIRPDLLWLETPYLLRYAIAHSSSIPVVVDYWGTSEGAEREFRHSTGIQRLFGWLRWKAALGGERRYAPCASNIVTVSDGDAEHFRRLAPKSHVQKIPMAVNPDRLTRVVNVDEDSLLMVMTGALSFLPNVDAAQYFVKCILPLIRHKIPGAKIMFAGNNPGEDVKALSSVEGVEVRGFADDLGQLISKGAIYVLPMRLGSGIRTKLFDVFPLARPIVSTSVGAEGLDLVDGRNCRIADAPELFAEICVNLLRDANERRRLGEAARQLADTVYSHGNVDKCLCEVLRSVSAEKQIQIAGVIK